LTSAPYDGERGRERVGELVERDLVDLGPLEGFLELAYQL
jgi:hypothetical protein